MAKSHKNIDWEYEVERYAQSIYFRKYNTLDYADLKEICEDEVWYFMENENDTMRKVGQRIRFRVRHSVTYGLPYDWRERAFFIEDYERELKDREYWRKHGGRY